MTQAWENIKKHEIFTCTQVREKVNICKCQAIKEDPKMKACQNSQNIEMTWAQSIQRNRPKVISFNQTTSIHETKQEKVKTTIELQENHEMLENQVEMICLQNQQLNFIKGMKQQEVEIEGEVEGEGNLDQ